MEGADLHSASRALSGVRAVGEKKPEVSDPAFLLKDLCIEKRPQKICFDSFSKMVYPKEMFLLSMQTP